MKHLRVGPYLIIPLSFLLLFFLLIVEKGRVRNIRDRKVIRSNHSLVLPSAVFSFAFLFVDGRKR
jgi:hypothetical protein